MPVVSPEQRVILLVEDQEADVVLIKRALENSGVSYPVQSVPGGMEALAYLSGDPPFHDRIRYPLPVLLLLDIRMPTVNGFEVLRWVRHHPEFARLPVAVLTGSAEIEDANRAYKLGANSFMVKPFDFGNSAELCRTVERLIAQKRP